MKAAELLLSRQEEFAEILATEVGKSIRESRGEVERAATTLQISAEEAKRIHGEGVPVESAQGSYGFYSKSPSWSCCSYHTV